jgi:hypothetical protein
MLADRLALSAESGMQTGTAAISMRPIDPCSRYSHSSGNTVAAKCDVRAAASDGERSATTRYVDRTAGKVDPPVKSRSH